MSGGEWNGSDSGGAWGGCHSGGEWEDAALREDSMRKELLSPLPWPVSWIARSVAHSNPVCVMYRSTSVINSPVSVILVASNHSVTVPLGHCLVAAPLFVASSSSALGPFRTARPQLVGTAKTQPMGLAGRALGDCPALPRPWGVPSPLWTALWLPDHAFAHCPAVPLGTALLRTLVRLQGSPLVWPQDRT